MKKVIVILSILLPLSISAQVTISNFKATQIENNVQIDWSIEAGSTCTGISLEHSSDSVNFTAIYEYLGICGSATEKQSYSYTHKNPIENVKNYYRLRPGMSSDYSSIIVINYIDYNEEGFIIYPNPIASFGYLYFKDSNSKNLSFVLYNHQGKEIHRIKNVKDNYILIEKTKDIVSGSYHFIISDGTNIKYEGRIVFL